MSKWIEFKEQPFKGITKILNVEAKENSEYLGTIKWFSAWRCYAFYPAPNTIFEKDCLKDITKRIEELMEERKMKKNEMNNLQTFESFNDPNNNPTEKVQISSYITKSDFFSLKKKIEKDFIKSLIGKEFKEFKKDNRGDFIIQTGDKEIKELLIPKKFIFEIKQKV